jgi:hypothetical protein
MSIRIEWAPNDQFAMDIRKMALRANEEVHLSKGLKLRVAAKGPVVSGGSDSEVLMPRAASQGDLGPLFDGVETRFNVRAMASRNHGMPLKQVQPLDAVFRVGSHLVRAALLGELLLAKMNGLQMTSRQRLIPKQKSAQFDTALERCAILRDEVLEGHLDKSRFDAKLTALRAQEPLLSAAFFISSLNDRADAVRASLLRGSYHLAQMTAALDLTNQTLRRRGKKPPAQTEVRHFSQVGDIVADEFASGVLACYGSLDLLRKLFDYTVREPFGEPTKPPDSLFDAALPSNLPAYSLARPLALPSIPPTHFKALYVLRSELFHNAAADYLRAAIYVGFALPPVNSEPLQYAQYMTRDLSVTGAALSHRWVPRFYAQRRDAQHALGEWLHDAWQASFDTVDWLIHHMSKMTPVLQP